MSARPMPRPMTSGSTNRSSTSHDPAVSSLTVAKPTTVPSGKAATRTCPASSRSGATPKISGCASSCSRSSSQTYEDRRCTAASASPSAERAVRITIGASISATPRTVTRNSQARPEDDSDVSAVAVVAVILSLLALVASWRRRAVLGGLCASAGGACAVLALVTGDTRYLLGCLGALVVGSGLVVVGEAVWALLSDEIDDGS